MEFITGVDMSKMSLPKTLAKEKSLRTKWFYGYLEIFKQAFRKRLQAQRKQQIDH